MREIVFRGKRTDTGEWVYGYYYSECGNTYIIVNKQGESMTKRNTPFLVKEDTVGQYTGLKDRNGTNVWEGDILRTPEGDIMVVEWVEGSLITRCLIPANEGYINTNRSAYPVCLKIGNLWDSPELLEKQK